MKIKVYGFTEDDIKNGFKTSENYEVTTISISGDYCAYDLFYQIRNNKGDKIWIFDLTCEIVEQEKEIEQLLEDIEKLWRKSSELNIPYKFNYRIDMEGYIDMIDDKLIFDF